MNQIPEKKIAIEVHGGNWHMSKRKNSQDIAKAAALSKAGWKLIIIAGTKNIYDWAPNYL